MRYKFYWNGIKDTETGKLYKCDYGYRVADGKGIDSITIVRENEKLPIIEDAIQYFNGNIGIMPQHKLYRQVEEALRRSLEHYKKIRERRNKKEIG